MDHLIDGRLCLHLGVMKKVLAKTFKTRIKQTESIRLLMMAKSSALCPHPQNSRQLSKNRQRRIIIIPRNPTLSNNSPTGKTAAFKTIKVFKSLLQQTTTFSRCNMPLRSRISNNSQLVKVLQRLGPRLEEKASFINLLASNNSGQPITIMFPNRICIPPLQPKPLEIISIQIEEPTI